MRLLLVRNLFGSHNWSYLSQRAGLEQAREMPGGHARGCQLLLYFAKCGYTVPLITSDSCRIEITSFKGKFLNENKNRKSSKISPLKDCLIGAKKNRISSVLPKPLIQTLLSPSCLITFYLAFAFPTHLNGTTGYGAEGKQLKRLFIPSLFQTKDLKKLGGEGNLFKRFQHETLILLHGVEVLPIFEIKAKDPGWLDGLHLDLQESVMV